MFLFIASTLFSNFPSIYNSPAEISSKPAIILKVVDLPQPDGPTKTTNSPSPISRLKSLTATKSFGSSTFCFEKMRLKIDGLLSLDG